MGGSTSTQSVTDCCCIELMTSFVLGMYPQTEALEDSEDEDQDFVEVPEKEGYEPRIPDHLRAEYGELWANEGQDWASGVQRRQVPHLDNASRL